MRDDLIRRGDVRSIVHRRIGVGACDDRCYDVCGDGGLIAALPADPRAAAATRLAEAVKSPLWDDDCGSGCVACGVYEGVEKAIRRDRRGDGTFPHAEGCAWVAWRALAKHHERPPSPNTATNDFAATVRAALPGVIVVDWQPAPEAPTPESVVADAPCPKCNGRGNVPRWVPGSDPPTIRGDGVCPTCNGGAK